MPRGLWVVPGSLDQARVFVFAAEVAQSRPRLESCTVGRDLGGTGRGAALVRACRRSPRVTSPRGRGSGFSAILCCRAIARRSIDSNSWYGCGSGPVAVVATALRGVRRVRACAAYVGLRRAGRLLHRLVPREWRPEQVRDDSPRTPDTSTVPPRRGLAPRRTSGQVFVTGAGKRERPSRTSHRPACSCSAPFRPGDGQSSPRGSTAAGWDHRAAATGAKRAASRLRK